MRASDTASILTGTLPVAVPDSSPVGGSALLHYWQLSSAAHRPGVRPLLYLGGGPGIPSYPPEPKSLPAWMKAVLDQFTIVGIDYRGAGQDQNAAAFLAHPHLAGVHSISLDLERLRNALFADQPWHVLGYSYGGFVALGYATFFPKSVLSLRFASGIPPIHLASDAVHAGLTAALVIENNRFSCLFPRLAGRIPEIASWIDRTAPRLKNGDVLSRARFQKIGTDIGMSYGFSEIARVLDQWRPGSAHQSNFLAAVSELLPRWKHPAHAVLIDTIYAAPGETLNWPASRALDTSPSLRSSAENLLFTGELAYPWMFEEYSNLRPYRRRAAVAQTASDWLPRVDERNIRSQSFVVRAVISGNDPYVPASHQLAALARLRGPNEVLLSDGGHDTLASNEAVQHLFPEISTIG
ncbi:MULTISPECIES: alpha/beta fold hydrolase [unclassified Microbacterium]|uniref:alpha/beta fold hydrolase n=1 Tax=unclassified Microbacterium TaxID=2609290 RepID=UPI000CFA92EB|nr:MULTISPECIES: alpha/beta fold hydrolase [unclassified Microbacterium]PQZ53031.1 hypothetical protein CQ032_16285 [Microbacterium sp. MYb43]PQZ73259.1 hypothetical protein CQ031_17640 [Microbacterium sp. MYb40]PRB18721.1 hypothetical protein CQ040_16735 [Microbacterium sp. MYb54]PRB24386.1 hypothetical protein CQ037_17060 [Microbacterium sp. MYb50]PRB64434.1 hypothetical protein CQ027_20010 [Microbacterium sp. MYb32]